MMRNIIAREIIDELVFKSIGSKSFELRIDRIISAKL